MTQEKKPGRSSKATRDAAAGPGNAPALRLAPPAALSPCEAALAAVIGLVGAAVSEAAQTGEEPLARALRDFEPEMALKLRALLLSGRDARAIPSVGFNGTLEESESALHALARDLSESGSLASESLRRGHALACAAGVPLEQPVSVWGAAIARNLDERAWLSFGRQLAKSEPDEWQCLVLLDAKAKQITKLYLKLGDNAWWSFQAQIDRPSATIVQKEERAVERRRSKGMAVPSLRMVAPQLRSAEGRALRRAARAIRARLGEAMDAR